MATALQLVGGDEIVEPFILENTDGSLVDLATVTIDGSIWWRGRERIPLPVGSSIIINVLFPVRAENPDDQVPHGFWHLTEDDTRQLPFGQIAGLRIVAVDGNGVTMSTYFYPLERIT